MFGIDVTFGVQCNAMSISVRNKFTNSSAKILALAMFAILGTSTAQAAVVTYDFRVNSVNPISTDTRTDPAIVFDTTGASSVGVSALFRGTPTDFYQDSEGAGPEEVGVLNPDGTPLGTRAVFTHSATQPLGSLFVDFGAEVQLLSITWLMRSSALSTDVFIEGDIIRTNFVAPAGSELPLLHTAFFNEGLDPIITGSLSMQSAAQSSGFSLVSITADRPMQPTPPVPLPAAGSLIMMAFFSLFGIKRLRRI